MRHRIGKLCALVAIALPIVIAVPGAASAFTQRNGFVAQARGAGLSTSQATALQHNVDAYLAKLGAGGKQISPNEIDMNGAVLSVTVPGESSPRRLDARSQDFCRPRAAYLYFCAYQYEWGAGDYVRMFNCVNYPILWYTVGSWENNQTPGTRPVAYFSGYPAPPPWTMPAAYSIQPTGVNWGPVVAIRPC